MSAFDPRSLRDAFGAFLTGVTVVTSMDGDGAPVGFTANSFTSVSLDPPLVLVCLSAGSKNHARFTSARGFAVNVLSEFQKDISNTFAKPVEDRFAGIDWEPGPSGHPVFRGVAAWFECSMHEVVNAGDHAILIGRVEAFGNSLANGLGYARGNYFTASLSNRAVTAAACDADVRTAALVERQGEILLFGDAATGYRLPECTLSDGDGPERLHDFLVEETGLSVAVGQIYSVYRDSLSGRQHIAYRCAAGDGAPNVGTFVPLKQLRHLTFVNSAIDDTLRRFAAEASVGNFGIYFGTEIAGTVHKLPRKTRP
jgi:flavin-dependent trigonelline monooxygenase, reductase component